MSLTTYALACSPRPKASKPLRLLLAGALWLLWSSSHAFNTLHELLQQEPPPQGVVIEIVEGDRNALASLLPEARAAIRQLRARNPEMDIAIVTHGREQFALQTEKAEAYQSIHDDVRSLGEEAVPVHVCGVHASWEHLGPEDFPDYVDVAPNGPIQIRQYQEMGYALMLISQP